MARVWDYFGFATCFAGLGYAGLCLVGSPGLPALPPALHALGFAAAMFVPVRVGIGIIKRRRVASAPPPLADQREAAPQRQRRKAPYLIRKVKPRSHFGVRGAPH